MTWLPSHGATDIRKIVGNLLSFFDSNQVAALAWASSTTLSPLTLYPTAQMLMENTYPQLGVIKRRSVTDDSDDGLRVRYELSIQIEVKATYPEQGRTAAVAQLQIDADNYAYAVESMILNIPPLTLFADVRGTGHGYTTVLSVDPLERAIGDTEAIFNVQLQMMMQFTETP